MFTVRELERPASVEAAYEKLLAGADNAVLAGCAYLRLGNKKIDTGIDLSVLRLDYVTETTDELELGAMVSLREIEINPAVRKNFHGMLSHSVEHIIGVQFRSMATLGAPVFSRYGFSDPLTALLALNTSVGLYKAGWMPLTEFLRKPFSRDILTAIRIKKDGRQASFQGFRNAASDYSLLNAAASCQDGRWTIAIGARPMAPQIAEQASAAMTSSSVSPEEAGELAAGELTFSANFRASAEYRRALCKILVSRAIGEVRSCGLN